MSSELIAEKVAAFTSSKPNTQSIPRGMRDIDAKLLMVKTDMMGDPALTTREEPEEPKDD